MLPYRDDNPTILTPYVTVALIAANIAVWIVVQGMGSPVRLAETVCELGLIPGDLMHRLPLGYAFPIGEGSSCVVGTGTAWYTLFTSMFLHGGWLHLLGNMWFLWLFGNNVEDVMGHVRFVIFYLACGLAAALAQVFIDPASAAAMVGASGAIGGIMGAYVVLYPRVRVHTIMWLILIFRLTRPRVGDARILVPAAGGRRGHRSGRWRRGLGAHRGIHRRCPADFGVPQPGVAGASGAPARRTSVGGSPRMTTADVRSARVVRTPIAYPHDAAFPPDAVIRNPGMPLDLGWVRDIRVNRSAVERRAATIPTRRSIKAAWQAGWLLRAITLMDLTTLQGDDTAGRVQRLCAKARRPVRDDLLEALGMQDSRFAWPPSACTTSFVETAVRALEGSGIPVAAVSTGFPAGLSPMSDARGGNRGVGRRWRRRRSTSSSPAPTC